MPGSEGYSLNGLEADTAALWGHAAQMKPGITVPGFAAPLESPLRKGREQEVPSGTGPNVRMRVSSPLAAAASNDQRRLRAESDGLATVPEAGRPRGGAAAPTAAPGQMQNQERGLGHRGSRESLHHAARAAGRESATAQGPSPQRRSQERFLYCGSQSHHLSSKGRRRQGPPVSQQGSGGALGPQSSPTGPVTKVLPAGTSPARLARPTAPSSANATGVETPREAKQAENVNNLVSIFRGSRFQDIDQQPAPEPLPEAGLPSPPASVGHPAPASVGNMPRSNSAQTIGNSASRGSLHGSMTMGAPVSGLPKWSDRGRSCEPEDSAQSDGSPDRFRHVTVASPPGPLAPVPSSPSPDIRMASLS